MITYLLIGLTFLVFYSITFRNITIFTGWRYFQLLVTILLFYPIFILIVLPLVLIDRNIRFDTTSLAFEYIS